MSQTRTLSWLEAITNTSIGFGISLLTWIYVIEPVLIHFDFIGNNGFPLWVNTLITGTFTVVSILRGFWVRRLYESYLNRKLTELSHRIEDWRCNRVT